MNWYALENGGSSQKNCHEDHHRGGSLYGGSVPWEAGWSKTSNVEQIRELKDTEHGVVEYNDTPNYLVCC